MRRSAVDLLRLGEVPDVADAVTGGLARGRVADEEVERLAVVADLRGAVVGAREGREIVVLQTRAERGILACLDRQSRPIDQTVAAAAARVGSGVLIERVERQAVGR